MSVSKFEEKMAIRQAIDLLIEVLAAVQVVGVGKAESSLFSFGSYG
jgi:hypothetical protein